ncbi:MAG TPA: FAD-dependent oxidoreductase [Pyrinomonadaceae bacterium]|nr:FAD-dependent oxidoreductase [Pyrinomonadaceae bacterium]
MNYDVAIIGAGIVGAACGASLSASGLRVLVLESNNIASGATAAGMGHIVLMDDSEAQLALTRHSRGLWNELAKELPAEAEYDHCGTIWVAADDDEMAEVGRKKSVYAAHGANAEILDTCSLRELEPNLRDDLAGGLLVRDDSVVYQLCATKFLLERSVRYGAKIRTAAKAVNISEGSVTLGDGEVVSAHMVINAAGIAAADLNPQLKIVKRKGHLAITERYPNFLRHQLIELGYLKSAHGSDADSVAFNIQPRSTGQMLLGSSRQFGVDDTEIDFDIVKRMTKRAFEYMPDLKALSTVRVWTGFRPATPDNLPYIGRIEGFENVYAACGHEGLGITTSLGTADLLTSMILGTAPAIPVEPYLPTRTITEH